MSFQGCPYRCVTLVCVASSPGPFPVFENLGMGLGTWLSLCVLLLMWLTEYSFAQTQEFQGIAKGLERWMEGMNDALHQQERIAARVKLIEPQIEGFGVSHFFEMCNKYYCCYVTIYVKYFSDGQFSYIYYCPCLDFL